MGIKACIHDAIVTESAVHGVLSCVRRALRDDIQVARSRQLQHARQSCNTVYELGLGQHALVLQHSDARNNRFAYVSL